jgi:hypothetical protein
MELDRNTVKIISTKIESCKTPEKEEYGLRLVGHHQELFVSGWTEYRLTTFLAEAKQSPNTCLSALKGVFKEYQYLLTPEYTEVVDLDGLRIIWDLDGDARWESDHLITDRDILCLFTEENRASFLLEFLDDLSSSEILGIPRVNEILAKWYQKELERVFIETYRKDNERN